MTDFTARAIADRLEARRMETLRHLLPAGRIEGAEYVCGNLRGDPGRSLRVHLGDKGLLWADFGADGGDSGRDLLALWTAVRCPGDTGAAMREAADWLGLDRTSPSPLAGGVGSREKGEKGEGPWHPQLGTPTAVFDYHDASGARVGAVCRWDRAGGKEIRPAVWRGDGWSWGAMAKPRVLYRLPDLLAQPDRPVLIVEGEKTADAAREIVEGYTVATWAGGAAAVAQTDWAALKGRNVTLWPDADEPGQRAVASISDLLAAIGAQSVRIVRPPEGVPLGWDLADPAPPNLDIGRLLAGAQDAAAHRLAHLGVFTAVELMAETIAPRRCAVSGIVTEGLTILGGKPKAGKSYLSLDWALAVAGGGAAMGDVACEAGAVLMIALEDDKGRLQNRLRAALQGMPEPARLHFTTRWRRSNDGGLEDLRAWLAAHPDTRLVIVDTLAKIRGERDAAKGVYDQDYAEVGEFKRIADDFHIALVLVHHLRKESTADPLDAISGTAGLTGCADSIVVLKREPRESRGQLYVRGRDLPETELALNFDIDAGRWTRLDGAADFRRSEARNAIIHLLTEAGTAMLPIDIARRLGRKPSTIRPLLKKMRSDGEVVRIGEGYALDEPA